MKTALMSMLAVLALGGAAWGQSLTVWTPLQGPSLEWLQQEAEWFTESFDVEVEVVPLALGELRERTLESAEEGDAADVLVGVPHDQIGEMAAGGVLASLTPYATDSYLEDLPDPARLAYTSAGKLIGLPLFVEGPALIVNTDLVPEIPATYEELIEVAQQHSSGDTFGFVFDITNFYYSYTWIHSFGGYVFARDANGVLDPGEIGLANEGAIEGGRALRALRFEHGLLPADTDYGVANSLFAQGAVAMTYDGPWAIAAFQAAGIPVDVAPLPPRADGAEWSGFMGVYGVLVNEFSGSKLASANLAKWLVRPGAQLALAEMAGRIPASESVVAQADELGIIAGFGAALQNAEPLPGIPEMGRVWQPMSSALTAITSASDVDVESQLEQAVRVIGAE